jgi:hypothetical protein
MGATRSCATSTKPRARRSSARNTPIRATTLDVADRGAVAHAMAAIEEPLDSGLRDRALLDVGTHFQSRPGVTPDTLVLVRPDDHVAAIAPIASDRPGNCMNRSLACHCDAKLALCRTRRSLRTSTNEGLILLP